MMKFIWNMTYKYIFNNLKKQFIIVLIFIHFNLNFKCILETNLSDHAQENILLQYNKNNVLWLIIYFSQKLNMIKLNYKIYDKKLLAII